MRLLALDIGCRRVGVALSDETGSIAQPLCVVPRERLAQEIARLCETHEVTGIVIGLPLTLSGGEEGISARQARQAGEQIQRLVSLPVFYWDERFTTAQAQRMLVSAGVRRADRQKSIDKIAAALILQGYLDAQAGGFGSDS